MPIAWRIASWLEASADYYFVDANGYIKEAAAKLKAILVYQVWVKHSHCECCGVPDATIRSAVCRWIVEGGDAPTYPFSVPSDWEIIVKRGSL